MQSEIAEWTEALVRWFHVFAGILWIGATWFFIWLDGRITEEEEILTPGAAPQVWMVHSGGFYIVEKQKEPALLPKRLHWFKYEALFTFLSGFFLLAWMYYLSRGMLVDERTSTLSHGMAVAAGIGFLVVAWAVYDLLWISPLGKQPVVAGALAYLLSLGAAWILLTLFLPRAAYLHLGAMFGTIMVANVWMRILPAQTSLLKATRAGGKPDMTLATRAKQRSRHNTYMVVPVVYLMISNHYPVTTWGSDHKWWVLAVLIPVGWIAARLFRGDPVKGALSGKAGATEGVPR